MNLPLVECKSNEDADVSRLEGFRFMEKIAPRRIAGKTVLTPWLRSVKRYSVHFRNLAKLSK